MPRTATPASRVRARRDPAVMLPRRPPEGDRHTALRGMKLYLRGQEYDLGPAIQGDPATSAAIDATATITVPVLDKAGRLALALADEALLLQDGARITPNGVVYVLQSGEYDPSSGELLSLVFEDEVSWRLKFYRSFRKWSRDHFTRAQAALELVKEASAPPNPVLNYFIPELTDKQRIAHAGSDQGTSTKKGTGASGAYRVQHERATALQRRVIDGVLAEAQALDASRRVMIATIMCITQESGAGRLMGVMTGNDDVGIFQQGRNWISVRGSKDPAASTRAFLVTGPTSWKKRHGSVKRAPGDLSQAIHEVQGNADPNAYAQWEDEATKTVDRWLGSSDHRTVVEPYEFTRGTKDGTRETSWDALARWAEDVQWRRWAEVNTLFYVSDEELRAAAPALEINGDEAWLLQAPGWSWAPDRPASEVTMVVLAERWGVRVGAAVMVATGGPADGRYIVTGTEGGLVSPVLTVTLRRPQAMKLEPPHETHQSSGGGGSAGDLLAACKTISGQNRAYVYGGGHKKLSSISAHEGLDCSSSVSLALDKAGMFPGSVAITSGAFASSWGKAGKGSDFTVWANSEHVWIEFNSGHYKRFDTSPHGNGPSGPHLRTTARTDQGRFTARHWHGR